MTSGRNGGHALACGDRDAVASASKQHSSWDNPCLLSLLELVANAIVTYYIAAVPERQPWRAVVTSLYLIGGGAGVVLIVWLIVSVL